VNLKQSEGVPKISGNGLAKKTFILGVGTARSGTTWLFNYLNKYEEVDFGFKKEYHVFDSVYLKSCQHFSASESCLDGIDNRTSFEKKYIKEQQILTSFQTDHDKYFDYFSELLAVPEILITGDITPSYCGLSEDVFEIIKHGVESRNIGLKIIFIMRDPVERIWSAARMAKNFRNLNGKRLDRSISIEDIVLDIYDKGLGEVITRYSQIVTTLKSVFSDHELYFGLFETMHSADEVERLSEFLNLPPNFMLSDKKVNAFPKVDGELKPGTIATIARHYAAEYKFCENFFSNADIKSIWQNHVYCDR
jgi:hypothetical protein